MFLHFLKGPLRKKNAKKMVFNFNFAMIQNISIDRMNICVVVERCDKLYNTHNRPRPNNKSIYNTHCLIIANRTLLQ